MTELTTPLLTGKMLPNFRPIKLLACTVENSAKEFHYRCYGAIIGTICIFIFF